MSRGTDSTGDVLGQEALGGPEIPDSEGYQSASEGYQEEEEYPRPSDLMPASALGEAVTGTDGLEPGRRDWQVNVRLDRERYGLLKQAADVYGTTPTALARMLLNRGSRAILNAHRAEMEAFEWADPRG